MTLLQIGQLAVFKLRHLGEATHAVETTLSKPDPRYYPSSRNYPSYAAQNPASISAGTSLSLSVNGASTKRAIVPSNWAEATEICRSQMLISANVSRSYFVCDRSGRRDLWPAATSPPTD